ncbi:unnamed protein product [Ambrosiozyma monospora]|uniref:Unnamed protein product n=1 Tax=Ambrosiozyma monospora TaxID=43982 RepID=A0A9W6YX76_AMBMO|nr:unnamed protein product [Ambrosiozyma monospora]
MRIFNTQFPNVKPQHAFIIPLLSTAAWWAMLTAMLVCWYIQGRPLYESKQIYFHLMVTFVSNIGATNLQPIFICGSLMMGIFYVWTMIEEWYLRTKEKTYLIVSFNKHTTNLHIAAIVFALLGSFCILMTSCLKLTKFDTAHNCFVTLFIVFVCTSSCCHVLCYLLYYAHYKVRWFLISALIKIIWILAALSLVFGYVVPFVMAMQAGLKSKLWGISGAFEWSLCYFYPVVLLILSVDLCKTKSSDYKRNKATVDQDDDDSDDDNNNFVSSGDVSELEKGRYVQSQFGMGGQAPLDTSLYGAAHFRTQHDSYSQGNTRPYNNYDINNAYSNSSYNNTYSNNNNNNNNHHHNTSSKYTNTNHSSSTYVNSNSNDNSNRNTNSNTNSTPYYTEKKLKMDSSSIGFESDSTLTADEASDYYPNRDSFSLPLSQLPPARLDRELTEQQSIYKIIDSYR